MLESQQKNDCDDNDINNDGKINSPTINDNSYEINEIGETEIKPDDPHQQQSMWNIFNDLVEETNREENETNVDGGTISDDEDDDLMLDFCKFCKTNSLEYDSGCYYCNICGVVQQKRLSQSAEYRYYGDGDNKNSNPERVGMPTNMLLPESSLGSLIGFGRYDNPHFKKMVQYNSWNAMPYKERSQWKVFNKISIKAVAAGLPNIIIETAKTYYKIISENSISRGPNRQGLIAACIYMACKKECVPRSSKEIASLFGINLHDMTRGHKKFKEIWRLSRKNKLKIRMSNPLDYIDRFCSNLRLSKDFKFISEFVAVRAISCVDKLVEDNTSPSVAAGAIYLVADEFNQNISKKQVALACQISEVTISKCHKKLKEYKDMLFPKAAIEKYNLNLS